MELRGAGSVHAPYETLKVKGAWPLCFGDSVDACLESAFSPDCCLPNRESIAAEVLPRRSAVLRRRRILLLDGDFRRSEETRRVARAGARGIVRLAGRYAGTRIRNPNTHTTRAGARADHFSHMSAAAAFFSASFATT